MEALVVLSAGLFIYATTVVKYLETCGRSEQQDFLAELLPTANSSTPQSLSDATSFTWLDTLYLQVLRQAFREFIPKTPKWVARLRISQDPSHIPQYRRPDINLIRKLGNH